MFQRLSTRSVSFGLAFVTVTLFALWWLGLPSPTINILTAKIQKNAGADLGGSIEITRSDAKKIIRREYYAKAHLFQCNAENDYYPAELSFNEIPLDSFQAVSKKLDNSPHDKIELSFSLPQELLTRYGNGCISLVGGQIVGFGRIDSNVVRLTSDD